MDEKLLEIQNLTKLSEKLALENEDLQKIPEEIRTLIKEKWSCICQGVTPKYGAKAPFLCRSYNYGR